MAIQWDETRLTITEDRTDIQLLPKEFALLRCLYEHHGQILSREQLLDRVWPREYPVERTVDDHIYRLRNKLQRLHSLEIKTVRGLGYFLQLKEPDEVDRLSYRDLELDEAMGGIFSRYHQAGQGKPMLKLADQQAALGFALSPFYNVYLHYVQADWEWLLETEEVPLKKRLYLLLLLLVLIGEPDEALSFCEQVLKLKLLAPFHHIELEFLNIIELYALEGMREKADQRIAQAKLLFNSREFSGFHLPLSITELYAALLFREPDDRIALLAADIENQLAERPYLRELGSYRLLKGLWLIRRGRDREGRSILEQAFEIMDMSGFVPLRLQALRRIKYACSSVTRQSQLRKEYEQLFHTEYNKQQGNHLKPQLVRLLKTYIHKEMKNSI